MVDYDSPELERMIEQLRGLVAHPSVPGDETALDAAAAAVADMFRSLGLRTTLYQTEGAPIVVAHGSGTSNRHVLFFNHYDVYAPGPWSEWDHEPWTLAEREGNLYGRGVAADKGNLVARIGAVQQLLKQGALPLNVSFVVEGNALLGSPYLPSLIADQADNLQADVVFGYGGQLDAALVPYIYGGVRGRLVVALSATGSTLPLAPELAASVINPAWRLIWALSKIKGDNEDILIEDFYDMVKPPRREISALVRSLKIDEAGRKEAWGIKEFMFGMTGATLARAEIFSPTCNVSLIQAGHSDSPAVPSEAHALLDFTLVPEQRPNEVLRLLRNHLNEHDFTDITVQPITGAYPASTTPLSSMALAVLSDQMESVYGTVPQVSPLAAFTQPLHLFTAGMNTPSIPLGLHHARARLRGSNEWLPLSSVLQMSRLLQRYMSILPDIKGDFHLLRDV